MVQDISAKLDGRSNSVNITWEKTISEPYFYGIYRGNDRYSMVRINTSTSDYFLDNEVIEGATYVYAVSAVCPLGGEGTLGFSNTITVYPTIFEMSDVVDDIWNMLNYQNNTKDTTINELLNMVSYINATFGDRLNWLITYVGLNNNLLKSLNISATSIISNITKIQNDINNMEDNIDSNLLKLLADLTTFRKEFNNYEDNYTIDISTISLFLSDLGLDVDSIISKLNGVDANVSDLDEKTDEQFLETMLMLSMIDLNITSLNLSLANLDSKVTSTMQEIISDMYGFNKTIRARIDLLELELEADILSLILHIEELNTSLNQELYMLNSDITSYKDEILFVLEELSLELENLSIELEGTESDLLIILNDINSMIKNIETTSIPQLRMKLDLLSLQLDDNATEILTLIYELQNIIDNYDSNITSKLENITTTLEMLNDLEEISDDIYEINTDLETLKKLEESLSNLESEQSDTSSSIIILIILIVIILIMLIAFIGIFINQSKKESPNPKTID